MSGRLEVYMSSDDVVERARLIMEKHGLSYTRLYGLSGVSAATWRFIFATGQLPKQARASRRGPGR
jgi:hypothetical protein